VAEPDAQVLEDVGGEVRLDHGARPLVAGVEIDGAEERLVDRRQERGLVAPAALLLALAEAEPAPQLQLARLARQHPAFTSLARAHPSAPTAAVTWPARPTARRVRSRRPRQASGPTRRARR